jgi:hypothetical protein
VEYDVILNREGSITMSECFMPFSISAKSGFKFIKNFRVVKEKGGESRDGNGNGVRRNIRENVLKVEIGKKGFSLEFKDIIPHLRSEVGASRRSVSGVLATSLILKLEIKLRKKHRPVSLSTIKNFSGHEIFKILVVGNDFDDMGEPINQEHISQKELTIARSSLS